MDCGILHRLILKSLLQQLPSFLRFLRKSVLLCDRKNSAYDRGNGRDVALRFQVRLFLFRISLLSAITGIVNKNHTGLHRFRSPHISGCNLDLIPGSKYCCSFSWQIPDVPLGQNLSESESPPLLLNQKVRNKLELSIAHWHNCANFFIGYAFWVFLQGIPSAKCQFMPHTDISDTQVLTQYQVVQRIASPSAQNHRILKKWNLDARRFSFPNNRFSNLNVSPKELFIPEAVFWPFQESLHKIPCAVSGS